ncbi:hypothetical protein A1Q2_05075 [Trichosporon asahii var. asahii CBS 8904]|uniref:Uncharacterized protein n=1 Tax=Trichosporon asahii var. asahii (strain CBS 8904) TaxID=1220162 RepID=K1VMJ4_TRIAC|nr:hypothetical protein A1Q2_05075 [Trichosporon asahii var. asahii CBS 8904]
MHPNQLNVLSIRPRLQYNQNRTPPEPTSPDPRVRDSLDPCPSPSSVPYSPEPSSHDPQSRSICMLGRHAA